MMEQPAASVAILGCSESEHAEAINKPETTSTSDLNKVPIVEKSALPKRGRQVFARMRE